MIILGQEYIESRYMVKTTCSEALAFYRTFPLRSNRINQLSSKIYQIILYWNHAIREYLGHELIVVGLKVREIESFAPQFL